MHKYLVNEARLELTLIPDGPVLIKAGEGNSDPIRPDMSFVRTLRGGKETVYLPGSSLKGVIRAHCERLARTVHQRLACDPLTNPCAKEKAYGDRDKMSGADKYRQSCFVCQLFGNTEVGSHLRIADAYPETSADDKAGGENGAVRTEERNGVAIDRVFGSVAVGPFNFEVVTAGEFKTTILLKNFTLPQMGLTLLALRDVGAGQVRIGFGKSRGLGAVKLRVDSLTLSYPGCTLLNSNQLQPLGGIKLEPNRLYGAGEFFAPNSQERNAQSGYGFPAGDFVALPSGYEYQEDDWLGVNIHAPQTPVGADWQSLGRVCANRWKAWVQS